MARARNKSFLRKLADYFALICFFFIVLALTAVISNLNKEVLVGPFRVVDGDSLLKGAEKLRLEGIDAPEWLQTCQSDEGQWNCGRQSAKFLKKLIHKPSAQCRGNGVDKYERLLVRCKSDTIDINSEMVLNGWALSFGDYHGEEASARRNNKGVWKGEFVRPREWREIHGDINSTPTLNFISHGYEQFKRWVGSLVK